MASGKRCCNVYGTTLRSFKSSLACTLDGSTKGMWRKHHGHTKENSKCEISALYGGFTGGKFHNVKENVMQDG